MAERGRRVMRAASLPACVLLGALVLLPAPVAMAHGDEHEPAPVEETPVEEMQPPVTEPPLEEPREPRLVELELLAPMQVGLGQEVRLEAVLRDPSGRPIVGVPVTFVAEAAWGEELTGEMVLGVAFTDEEGKARIATDLRTSGEVPITARFPGSARFAAVEVSAAIAVVGDDQLYTPETRLKLPSGGWWLLALVAAVWGTYLLVARQVLGVARAGVRAPETAGREAERLDRRRFLGAFALPAGLMAAVGSLGSGLLTVIARSPRTHGNREPSGWHTGRLRHRVTQVARVGAHPEMRPVPDILEREVSFNEEILPILLRKGGPHVHPSTYSPPPHGVRLDSYAAIMGGEPDAHAEEGEHAEPGAGAAGEASPGDGGGEPPEEETHGHRLVEPGRPEESMLVMMLLDPGHQMPPSVPLTEEEIQLIASWVAQGARNN